MKKLLVLGILTMLLIGCTVSQTQSGSGTATNKPSESTTTTSTNG